MAAAAAAAAAAVPFPLIFVRLASAIERFITEGKDVMSALLLVEGERRRWRLGCENSPRGWKRPGRGITQPSLVLNMQYVVNDSERK